MSKLIEEIRRRSVWQVLGLYAAGAWVVLQVVDVLANNFDLPEGFPAFALVLLVIGLPVVLATAFVQQRLHRASTDRSGPEAHEAAPSGPVLPEGASRVLTWRNVIGAGIGAAALWGVVVTVWLLTQGGPGAADDGPKGAPSLSRSTIAVLPFSVRGSGELSYLGEGMVNLLGTKLDGAGDLRSVDARALLSYVGQAGHGTLDPANGEAIARRFGAGLFVLGDIIEASGHLQLTATLYETDGPRTIVEGASEGHDAFALVDDVATQLLAGVEGGPGARVRRIAAVTTTSLPALRAYLEGEVELRSGRFESALAAFQRAVDIDSLYALAYYRLSVAAEWLTRPEASTAAAENAYRYAGRLSERDRRLLEAAIAWRRGAYEEAEIRYRSLVGTYPSDVEAWFQLGEILFHANPLRGRPFVESREVFERVLSFEPDHAMSIVHLARLAAREGRWDDLDALVARFMALNPEGDRVWPMEAMHVFARGDSAAQDSFVADLERAPDLSQAQSAWEVATYLRDLEGAERLTRLLTRPGRSPEVRTAGHAYLAYLRAARGRWQDAWREIEAIGAYDPVAAAEYRALLSLAPLAPVPPAQMSELRERVERLDPREALRSDNPSMFFNAHDDIHGVIRLYLIGVLSARLGDPEAAHAYASRLDTSRVPGPDLAASVRSQMALYRGLVEDALAAMEGVRQVFLYNVTLVSPVYNLTLERFTRGELLRELGRPEEALGWYANIGDATSFELPYMSAGHLRRAEIFEALGEMDRAAEQYAAFVALWRNADPALQPLVEQARGRLEELSSGSP